MLKKHWLFLLIILFLIILKIIFLTNVPEPILDESKYYIPAARAYLEGAPDPNFQHPPLGKEILAVNMFFFGDNSLGWRLFSILAGFGSLALTYILALKLSKKTAIASFAVAILGFETLWFLYSTLAFLEIFLVFFSLLALLFLWLYIEKPCYKHLIFFSLSIGAAVAVKWSALLLLPPSLILALLFSKESASKILINAVFSLSIIILVYTASYIPYLISHTTTEWVTLHRQIYEFHNSLTFKNVFGYTSFNDSLFYHPIGWFLEGGAVYTLYKQNDSISRLVTMINPFVLWGGTILFFWYVLRKFLKCDPAISFIVLNLIFLTIPWLFVSRVTYIYYLLSSLPLFSILIAFFLFRFWENPLKRWDVYGFLAANAVFFFVFLPLLVGIQTHTSYLAWLIGYPK